MSKLETKIRRVGSPFNVHQFVAVNDFRNLTVLVGANASGKSTALRALAASDVYIDGKLATTEFVTAEEVSDINRANRFSTFGGYSAFNRDEELLQMNDEFKKQIKNTFSYFVKDRGNPTPLNFFQSTKVETGRTYELSPEIIYSNTFVIFGGRKMNLRNLPSGIKRLIRLSKVKVKRGSPTLVLFDEADNHLHPSWIHLLAKLVKNLARKNVFVILSTHSVELLYSLSEDWRGFATPFIPDSGSGLRPTVSFRYIQAEKIVQRINQISEVVNTHAKRSKPLALRPLYKNFQSDHVEAFITREMASLLLSNNENVVIVEGPTDQLFFRNRTDRNVIATFGWTNIPVYVSVFEGLHEFLEDQEPIGIIVDGDADAQGLRKALGAAYQIFAFKTDLETDIFGKKITDYGDKRCDSSWSKYLLMSEKKNARIPANREYDKLRKILGISTK